MTIQSTGTAAPGLILKGSVFPSLPTFAQMRAAAQVSLVV